MTRCCMRCRSVPGICALQRACHCHAETTAQRARRLEREFMAAVAQRKHAHIPEHTQRAILAAKIGADGAVEVARAHGVTVSVVYEIWRPARKGD